MNADAFRHLYEYHFAENRTILDKYVPQLTEEQFAHDSQYSRGSIRDQLVHLVTVDEAWFSGLRGVEIPDQPTDLPDRASLHAYWDRVEGELRAYLNALEDGMLFTKPLSGEDKDLMVWQVLVHVINHGTDHRAQILRQLNDDGIKTTSQDYIFFAYDHPLPARVA